MKIQFTFYIPIFLSFLTISFSFSDGLKSQFFLLFSLFQSLTANLSNLFVYIHEDIVYFSHSHLSFFSNHLILFLGWAKKPVFFPIQFVFITIHELHCTFWYYSWALLYYFSYLLALSIVFLAKSFQFQLNKQFSNRHLETNKKLYCVSE